MVLPLSMGPGFGSSITGSLSRRAGIAPQIPLLVFIDRHFKEYRDVGFTKVSADDFLAREQKLIELARTTSLPNGRRSPRPE